jgi:anti-sigma factor RsiW
MNCAELRERVAPLLDGELSRSDRRAAEAHLDACPSCAEFLASLAVQPLGPRRALRARRSEPCWDRLDQALDAEAARPPRLWGRLYCWTQGEFHLKRAHALLLLAAGAAALAWASLSSTPDPLPVVGKAGVPDAGTQGSTPDPRQALEPASYSSTRRVY